MERLVDVRKDEHEAVGAEWMERWERAIQTTRLQQASTCKTRMANALFSRFCWPRIVNLSSPTCKSRSASEYGGNTQTVTTKSLLGT